MRSVALKRLGMPWKIRVGGIENAFSAVLEVSCFPHL